MGDRGNVKQRPRTQLHTIAVVELHHGYAGEHQTEMFDIAA